MNDANLVNLHGWRIFMCCHANLQRIEHKPNESKVKDYLLWRATLFKKKAYKSVAKFFCIPISEKNRIFFINIWQLIEKKPFEANKALFRPIQSSALFSSSFRFHVTLTFFSQLHFPFLFCLFVIFLLFQPKKIKTKLCLCLSNLFRKRCLSFLPLFGGVN